MADSSSILESLNSQLTSIRAEIQEIRSAVASRDAAGMAEDTQGFDGSGEDELPGQQWATVLDIATVGPTKSASLSLSLASLLTAPPHWSKCEGRGRE